MPLRKVYKGTKTSIRVDIVKSANPDLSKSLQIKNASKVDAMATPDLVFGATLAPNSQRVPLANPLQPQDIVNLDFV
jgi:hypothetical protein